MLSTPQLERKSRVPAPKTVHVAVHHDEPLDEKIVGCLTCETIIGLSEEYRLTEIFVECNGCFAFKIALLLMLVNALRRCMSVAT